MRMILWSTCLSSLALASGFYMGDNGTKTIAQGGAFVAQADDLTAIQHNPAGLAQLNGFQFVVDGMLLQHDVTFLRQDVGFNEAAPSKIINTVENKGGLFFLPFGAVGFGFKLAGRPFTVSLGIFAPPSVGRNAFAEPNYTKTDTGTYVERPIRFAPQRYALINNDIFVAYPTLSAAYQVHPKLSIGVSVMLVLSNFTFRQVLFAGDTVGLTPTRQLDEDPDFDALVGVNLQGVPTVTGIFGALFKPTDWLAIGASFRPPAPITAKGKVDIKITNPSLAATTTVEGDQATLNFTFPMEIKLGARLTPTAKLGINLDFVYNGWQSVDALTLTPNEVYLVSALDNSRNAVQKVRIEKQWQGTVSARLGGTYDIIQYLSVHAGVMFETAAAPAAYYNIDYAHPTRFMVSGGLSGHLGPIDITLAGLYFPNVTTVVKDGAVLRGQSDVNNASIAVNNGIYNSGAYGGSLGIRGNFGDKK